MDPDGAYLAECRTDRLRCWSDSVGACAWPVGMVATWCNAFVVCPRQPLEAGEEHQDVSSTPESGPLKDLHILPIGGKPAQMNASPPQLTCCRLAERESRWSDRAWESFSRNTRRANTREMTSVVGRQVLRRSSITHLAEARGDSRRRRP